MVKIVPIQSKSASGAHDLGLFQLDDATLVSSNEEDARLVVMAADICTDNPSLSVSFHAQSINHF